MRKLILTIFASLLLFGCSNDKEDIPTVNYAEENETEVDDKEKDIGKESKSFTLKPINEFIEHYNNMASLTDDLSPLSLEQPKDENNTQILLQENTYAILAIFDDDDDVITYAVGLTRDDNYTDLKGSGINAMMHIAEALELDFEKASIELETALSKNEHSYVEDDYMVIFENHERSGASGLGMMVRFMGLSIED